MNPGRSSVPNHEIDELANALRQHGILQPIVVHRADAAGRLAAPRPRLARPHQHCPRLQRRFEETVPEARLETGWR